MQGTHRELKGEVPAYILKTVCKTGFSVSHIPITCGPFLTQGRINSIKYFSMAASFASLAIILMERSEHRVRAIFIELVVVQFGIVQVVVHPPPLCFVQPERRPSKLIIVT